MGHIFQRKNFQESLILQQGIPELEFYQIIKIVMFPYRDTEYKVKNSEASYHSAGG